MQQTNAILGKLKFFTIFLVSFLFVFGVASQTQAAECIYYNTVPTPSPAHNTDDCEVSITFEDLGGAELVECKYKIVPRFQDPGDPSTWSSDWSSGNCSSTPATMVKNLLIPETYGQGDYDIHGYAKDNASNENERLVYVIRVAEKPSVITNAASDFIGDMARINGNLTLLGGEEVIVNVWFEWGLTTAYGNTTPKIEKIATGSFSRDISGLVSGSTYHFRAVSQNIVGIAYGADQEFIPADTIKPTVESFNVVPLSVNDVAPNVTVSWQNARDTGGSYLQQGEIWRANFVVGTCENGTEGTCSWSLRGSPTLAPAGSDGPWSSQATDSPSVNGTYWYGLHIVDGVGNWVAQPGPPKKVQVNFVVPPPEDDPLPDTSITKKPLDPTTSTTASFTFSGTNSPTSFQCKYDLGAWEQCTSPKDYFSPVGEHTFAVKARNSFGEDLSPASWSWTVVDGQVPPPPAENETPAIQGSIGVSPSGAVKANTNITFSASWSDANPGEQVKLFVCKGVLSGTFCDAQGSWCEGVLTTNNPATCTYTTIASDNGSNTYNAYVCDAQDACSAAEQGSFNVDAVAPAIFAFDVNPKKQDGLWVSSASPNVTISWHAIDSGSGLREVQVWRSSNGGVTWQQVPGSPFAAPSADWTYSVTDSSTASGTYLYGIHVVDVAGNEITETEAGFSIIEVQVDKDTPTTLVDAPIDSWLHSSTQQQSFLKTTDEDLDSGLDLSECAFEVCSYEQDGTEHCKGAEARACNITTNIEELFVGPSATHCDYQGRDACYIFVNATDNVGNTGESFESYNIDWEFPQFPGVEGDGLGKLYTTLNEEDQTYPIFVSEDSPVTYRVHVTDTVELNYCSLYIDNILEQAFVLPGGGCTQDCVVEFENVQLPDPGGDHTYENNYAVCYDASLQGSQSASADIMLETFGATLSADPLLGSTNTKFDLAMQVTGTAVGNANFKFDCTNDATFEYEIDDIDLSVSDPGWVTRQGEKTKVTAPDTFTVKDLCTYSSPSIYTANALAERGISSAQDTAFVDIETNDSPQAINLQDNNSSADYCFVSTPPIILSWVFSDSDVGDSQSAYQVQIATNSGFGAGAIVVDTGKVLSGNSEYSPSNLFFNATYYWRVMVWDVLDDISSFTEGVSFTTPIHAYPFSDFTWVPLFPVPDEEIQFQDATVFAPGSINQSWLWSFGDGTTSSQQNPTHIYEESSPYLVGLRATDDAGSCGAQGDVDGDGIPNDQDDDIDGDGVPNGQDPDIDGDGILNGQDSTPNGQSGFGGGGQGASGSGESIINVTLPIPEWQEISPF